MKELLHENCWANVIGTIFEDCSMNPNLISMDEKWKAKEQADTLPERKIHTDNCIQRSVKLLMEKFFYAHFTL